MLELKKKKKKANKYIFSSFQFYMNSLLQRGQDGIFWAFSPVLVLLVSEETVLGTAYCTAML